MNTQSTVLEKTEETEETEEGADNSLSVKYMRGEVGAEEAAARFSHGLPRQEEAALILREMTSPEYVSYEKKDSGTDATVFANARSISYLPVLR